MTIHLETNPFGLHNMQWFNVISQFEVLVVLGHQVGKVVECLARGRKTFSVRSDECIIIQRRRSGTGRRQCVFFSIRPLFREVV